MFTPLLDTLLFFTMTTPGIGLLAHRLHRKRLTDVYASLGFSLALLLHALTSHNVLAPGVLTIATGVVADFPLGVTLVVDDLSGFMATIYLLIGLLAAIYSLTYMARDTGLPHYYTLLLGITAGMIGVTSAGDLFTLFVFWEVMCLCSYALVAFRTEGWEPIEAGFKYLLMSGAGSLAALAAMALLYGLTGTLNIAQLSQALSDTLGGPWSALALLLFIAGFGLQAGMAPFHTWLPDAHSAAPAPVSAVLSGAMVMTGIYGLFRVLTLIFTPFLGVWPQMIRIFATVTMFTGNLLALFQDDVKRLLAFSTIANIGYILLGLATQSVPGLTGSLFQILNHALVKALLFLCSGSFNRQAKTRSLRDLAGIGRSMPWTCTVFILGTVALAGIPPLNIFWSEWTILVANVEAEQILFAIVMAANLVLSAAYCLRIIQILLLHGETPTSRAATEAPLSLLIPQVVLGALCVIIGVYPDPFRFFAEATAKATLNIHAYVSAVLG